MTGGGNGRLRPISLEIRARPTDDRVVLSRDENQHGDQPLDLDASIDALLDEIDAACAGVEDPDGVKTPERSGPTPDDAAGETAAETADEAAETDGGDGDADDMDDATQDGQEALDALDEVETRAQSLIEDSIDTLLESEPGDEGRDDAVDAATIDAQLDELETSGGATRSDGATHGEDVLPGADDLLAEIADELTNASETDGGEPSDGGAVDGVTEGAPANALEAAPEAGHEDGSEDGPEDGFEVGAEAGSSAEDERAEADEPAPSGAQGAYDNSAAKTDPVAAASVDADDGPEPAVEAGDGPDAGTPETKTDDEPVAETGADADASTLDDLDAALADLGDDLLGDFETPEGDLVDADSLDDDNASALLEQLGLDDLESDGDEESTAPAAKQDQTPANTGAEGRAVHEPVEPDTRATEQPARERDRARTDGAAASPAAQRGPESLSAERVVAEPAAGGEVRSIWDSAWAFIETIARRGWTLLRTHGVPLGARMVLVVNQPIRSRPAQLRDSIGYLALWTLLMATILWVYLAFVRESPTPTPTQAPSRVMAPGEVVDPLRGGANRP